MSKSFASQNDLQDKQTSFVKLAQGCYAYTAEGDPNSGVIIGEDAIMVVEAQATPRMAKDVMAKIRSVSDKPIKYLVLSHYHAVRVLGASEYKADEIIMSDKTLDMVNERGKEDWLSEFQRFPRLFRGHESIPGLTYPSITFSDSMSIDLGNKKVIIKHVGEGHTRGDAVVWLPEEKVLFAGDLVEFKATPYCGDAQLAKWPKTLDVLANLSPEALVPGRGDALQSPQACLEAIQGTKDFVSMLFSETKKCIQRGYTLKESYDHIMEIMQPLYGDWVIFEHCLCFNVKRAYDEANGIEHPKIWTDAIDMEMWKRLKT